MTRFAVAGTLAVILLASLIISGHDNAAHAAGPSFTLSWDTSSSTVNVGDSFTLEVRLHNVSGTGDHGGISVSFPWLTDSGASSYSYSSSKANVEVLSYTTARSRVSLYDRGDTIYDSGNRQIRADYLLVEADDPSWSSSSDRLLRLRISPKQANDSFSIQLRGWICADEYQDCSRAPSSGGRRDQQGWPVENRTVTVVSQDSDDHGNRRSDATTISTETSVGGNIETSGDIDFFSFSADPGVTYTIETNLLSIDDTVLWLYGSNGSSIEENDDYGSGYASRIQWTPQSSGTYYATVGGYDDNTGTYRLSISAEAAPPPPSDDHGNSRSDATAINTDASVAGNIETSGDVDFFSFIADSGVTYTIETNLLSIDDTVLWLYGSSGSSIEENDDYGSGYASRIQWTPQSSGTYYATVGGYDDNTGTYRLSISAEAAPPPPSDDHGNSRSDATAINTDASVAGNIETSGDVDFFSFIADSGVTYTMETNLLSIDDTVLWLYGSSGSHFDHNDDYGSGYASRIQWTPQATAVYYAAVGGYDDNTGTYRLSISAAAAPQPPQPSDDHGNRRSDATAISTETPVGGDIETSGDIDFFSFSADSGVTYTIETTLSSIGDTVLWLYGSSGSSIEENDDYGSGYASRIQWTPQSSGTYYAAVGGFDDNTGTYRLSISAAAAAPINDRELFRNSSFAPQYTVFEKTWAAPDIAIPGYSVDGTSLTIRLFPRTPERPLPILLVRIESELGESIVSPHRMGSIGLLVPINAWVDYEDIQKSVRTTEGDYYEPLDSRRERDQAVNIRLTDTYLGLMPFLGGTLGAADFFSFLISDSGPSPQGAEFNPGYGNCFRLVTVPFIPPNDAGGPTGISVAIPINLDSSDSDYISLVAEYHEAEHLGVQFGRPLYGYPQHGAIEVNDILAMGREVPDCNPPP